MEITGLQTQFQSEASTDKKSASKGDSEMFGTFENQILNWEEKIKEKIQKEIEDDNKKTIDMSDKQWNALIKKVDTAIDSLSNK